MKLVKPVQDTAEAKPPCNIEAEAALIGSCIIANQCVEHVGWLPSHAFFEPLHQRLWSRIIQDVAGGREVTVITLLPYFRDDAALKALGGPAYLAGLTSSGAGLLGVRTLAEQIAELHQRRELIGALNESLEVARDTSDAVSAADAIRAADKAISSAVEAGARSNSSVVSVGSCLLAALERHDAVQAGVESVGIQQKFLSALDMLFCGNIEQGELIVLAGRPAMGKTAVVTSLARCYAEAGNAVMLFEMEMTRSQLAIRQLTDLAYEASGEDFSLSQLKKGTLSRYQRERAAEVALRMENLPIYIDDTAKQTLADIVGKTRRLKRRLQQRGQELKVVIIDYLQLIECDSVYKGQRVNEISELTRGLKIMAKDLNVAVLLLSQLSRAVEQREDKRPMLSDLRDSGSIEQDADSVIFLYREEYYLQAAEPKLDNTIKSQSLHDNWETEMAKARNRLSLIAAKLRHGQPNTVNFTFLSKFMALRDPGFLDNNNLGI